ncbi:hypothetical protein [Domibacillus epiphyticus]|nr:hypothetical protein [Domibacillus epiphyticus]
MFWVFDAVQIIILTVAGMALLGIGWVSRPVWDRYKKDQKNNAR